eukprot:m.1378141 g.1378141  ORF g.1378141 m.1378141 type:complete len:237 (-) comp24964_c2_seq30:2762-3472(-)
MQELAGQTRGFRLPRTQCVCCTGGARCWRRDSLDQRPTRGQDAVDIPSTTPPMTSDTHYQGNKETSKSILYTPSGPPWCSPIHCATRIQIPIYIHTHRRRALSGCAGRAPSSRPTKGEHGAADVSTATVPGSRSNSSVADRVRSGTPMALRSALCAGPVAVRRAAAPCGQSTCAPLSAARRHNRTPAPTTRASLHTPCGGTNARARSRTGCMPTELCSYHVDVSWCLHTCRSVGWR